MAKLKQPKYAHEVKNKQTTEYTDLAGMLHTVSNTEFFNGDQETSIGLSMAIHLAIKPLPESTGKVAAYKYKKNKKRRKK